MREYEKYDLINRLAWISLQNFSNTTISYFLMETNYRRYNFPKCSADTVCYAFYVRADEKVNPISNNSVLKQSVIWELINVELIQSGTNTINTEYIDQNLAILHNIPAYYTAFYLTKKVLLNLPAYRRPLSSKTLL